ncbi:MAG TPA: SIS domain-containing protein [Gemmatimonadaceae bacterium]
MSIGSASPTVSEAPAQRSATTTASDPLASQAQLLLERRTRLVRPFFDGQAGRLARLCHRMAERFARGGRLMAFGHSPAALSDVRHIAVEFVHPVIVGKRALPAMGLIAAKGRLEAQLAQIAEPSDIAVAFPGASRDAFLAAESDETRAAIAFARQRGCLTVAFTDAGAEWEIEPSADDPFVAQEIVETVYHVLWELVHVFFEHKGLLADATGATHDAGASSFLYPFLDRRETDLERVLEDVRRSAVMKAEEITNLRIRAMSEGDATLCSAARALRSAFENGAGLLVLGNGGSATDAMDAAADYRFPPPGWRARKTIDLTEDTAIITAIANDIGADAIFLRQIIAYGRRGDVAMAFTTSGNSRNIVQALEEARRRGLATIAFVGYDGGEIMTRDLADYIFVVPSEYIPRIQEAQATAHHILRELVELA